MTKKLIKIVLVASVCITVCFIMAGCSKKKDVTLGEISGNTYSNDYFGFEFTFPDNWDNVTSTDDTLLYTKSLNKADLSKEIDLAQQDRLVLFMSTNSSGGKLASISVSAYKKGAVITSVGEIIEITTAEEYLERDISSAAEQYPNIKLNDINNTKFGSKEFKYWEQSVPLTNIEGGTEYNYIYVCESNGYIVCFSAFTHYDVGKTDIESIINSINFK